MNELLVLVDQELNQLTVAKLVIDILIVLSISLILCYFSKYFELYDYRKKLENTVKTLKTVRQNAIDFFIEMKEFEFKNRELEAEIQKLQKSFNNKMIHLFKCGNCFYKKYDRNNLEGFVCPVCNKGIMGEIRLNE